MFNLPINNLISIQPMSLPGGQWLEDGRGDKRRIDLYFEQPWLEDSVGDEDEYYCPQSEDIDLYWTEISKRITTELLFEKWEIKQMEQSGGELVNNCKQSVRILIDEFINKSEYPCIFTPDNKTQPLMR